MEKFQYNFKQENLGERVIRNIFPVEGRKTFNKKVEEVLLWSEKGGPKIGTPLFIKGVVGRVDLKPEELAALKKEINKEIKKIKNKRSESNKKKVDTDYYKKLIPRAKMDMEKELRRSGGIDPNEL
jgi:hypothetical protein